MMFKSLREFTKGLSLNEEEDQGLSSEGKEKEPAKRLRRSCSRVKLEKNHEKDRNL